MLLVADLMAKPVKALIEIAAGLAFLVVPALPIGLLVGETPATATEAIGRVAGAGLLSLGLVCWWQRGADAAGARSIVAGMLVYNAAIVVLVLSGSLGSLGLWLLSVAATHGLMAVWGGWLLRVVRAAPGSAAPGTQAVGSD